MLSHEQSKTTNNYKSTFFSTYAENIITSAPHENKNVIALFFNQLIAGGVIRGIRVMSTNEGLPMMAYSKLALT